MDPGFMPLRAIFSRLSMPSISTIDDTALSTLVEELCCMVFNVVLISVRDFLASSSFVYMDVALIAIFANCSMNDRSAASAVESFFSLPVCSFLSLISSSTFFMSSM